MCLVMLPGFSACGKGEKTTSSDVVDADTALVDETPKAPERLADTVYASAKVVSCVVTVMDESVSGMIDDLTDLYADRPSTLTFRKDLSREGLYGELDKEPTGLKIDWKVDTELETKDTKFGPWGGGSGWTGQPLYVEWPDSVAARMKQTGAVNSNFDGKEVLVGSLCGKVYFMNPESGALTREPISAGNPIKGTPSVDPTFNGNLYVGQGTPAQRPFGAVVINLFENKITDIYPEDPKAQRRWGAYDSSPVRVGQFLFRPSENGSLYKYLVKGNDIKLHSVARYKVNGAAPGMEASMAVYANYGFTADNHGNIIGFNLDNLKPVWYYRLGDDTDATPALAIEDGKPYIYVGCEVDLHATGTAAYVKLDALTGQVVWEQKFPAQRMGIENKHFDGGFYASTLIGKADCEDLIFTNRVINSRGQNGVFMAINRKDGSVAYEVPLRVYSWSSPVGFTVNGSKMIVLTGDGGGNLYLIEGRTGKIINCTKVGNNFESSPLVLGHSVIIGSRGNGIYKVTLE